MDKKSLFCGVSAGKPLAVERKKIIMIAVLTAAGIILLLFGGFDLSGLNNSGGKASGELSDKIALICGEVDGVSDVHVLLTLDDAVKTSSDDGDASLFQTVRGISVVCRSESPEKTREILTELLSCSLGIPTNRIYVVCGGINDAAG